MAVMSSTLQAAAGRRRTDTRLWHPFAKMSDVREHEFVLTRGEDVWVWDDQGRRYYDGTASLWYANVGHGRREIAEAIARPECWRPGGPPPPRPQTRESSGPAAPPTRPTPQQTPPASTGT